MNKSFRFAILAAAFLTLASGVASAQSRIATVDLVKVFNEYWKTKQSKLALEESKTEIKKELESMQDTQKKLAQQYQKLLTEANDQAVSSDERDKRKKALEPRLKELQEGETNLKQFLNRSEAELKMKTDRMLETVIKDIKTVVASKARAGSFAYVVDTSAKSLAQTEVFLYSNGEADLTDTVVKDLNAAAPADFDKAK